MSSSTLSRAVANMLRERAAPRRRYARRSAPTRSAGWWRVFANPAHSESRPALPANADVKSAMSRRGLLSWAIGGLGMLSAALVGVPVFAALFAPAAQPRRRESWTDFGSVEGIPVGTPRLLTAVSQERDGWGERSVRRAVWVVRSATGSLTVFSARCTHLGCAYRWDARHGQFACPCHGGTFAITGEVTGGPPPRGLTRLSSKIEDGTLRVRFGGEEIAS
jgi:menaquinol-cytochrome c reductase iron-sulfur subunit